MDRRTEGLMNAIHRSFAAQHLLIIANAVKAMQEELALTDLDVKAEIIGLTIEMRSLSDKIAAAVEADKDELRAMGIDPDA